MSQQLNRIDVVFDRYSEESIKTSTRTRRKKGAPIWRVIISGDIPLPHDWSGFLSNSDNKADLAHFLSNEISNVTIPNNVLVVAGGFPDETKVFCNQDIDIHYFHAKQEEADTCMILHCVHAKSNAIVVHSRDTDVLLLLIDTAQVYSVPSCT